jgi:DNA-binding CsgD family transcriptional regulator
MNALDLGGMANDEMPPAALIALTDWIRRDVHPRFIINTVLGCLWENDAARRMLEQPGANVSTPAPSPLTFFNHDQLRSLLEEIRDDRVHWGVISDRNGNKLIVWAKAIGDGQDRLFGLVLMPPDREQDFKEFFEHARLTPAEARIIDAILRGESLASTATVSGVSKQTIKTQLKNAYRKLSVSSRGELFAQARRYLAP